MKRRLLRTVSLMVFILLFLAAFPALAGLIEDENKLFLPLVFRSWPPPPPPGRIVISEVMANPFQEPDGEWIEIANIGGIVLDLTGYKIGDEETQGDREGMLQFPPGTLLQPGQAMVIAYQALPFQNQYGFPPDFEMRESDPSVQNLAKYTAWSGGNVELSNNGDEVLILNPSNQLVDAVSWGNSEFAFSPAVPAVGDGHSIERYPVTQDTDRASDWIDQAYPQPGTAVLPTSTPTATLTMTSTPTQTQTAIPTASVTPTHTMSPTISLTPSLTTTPTPSATGTITPTMTPTSTSSLTPTFTATPTLTSTPTVTLTSTPTPTDTHTPTPTPTGTPGEQHLLISEVLYDPNGTEPDNEWIEIYNPGSMPIDLSGYKLGDEETQGGGEGMMQFPDGFIIPPGGVLVVANKASVFQAAYGFLPDLEMSETDPTVPNLSRYTAWASGTIYLANDGDEVILLGPVDQWVDALSWGSSSVAFNPPAPDVTQGHSLERLPAAQDTDTAEDWIDQPVPAPGLIE